MIGKAVNRSEAAAIGLPGARLRMNQPRLRLVLGAGVLFAASVVMLQPAAHWVHDPELFRLLRGMGVLKIVLAALALAVVWWRLGQALSPRLQTVFVGAVWALSLAAGLIWQLTMILPASALFHLATLSLLVAAWRDIGPRMEQQRAAANRHSDRPA